MQPGIQRDPQTYVELNQILVEMYKRQFYVFDPKLLEMPGGKRIYWADDRDEKTMIRLTGVKKG